MSAISLTPAQRTLLDRQRVGRFATVDEHGQPHVVPVCYVMLDGALYTAIDEKPKRGNPLALRRIRNLLARPAVCLVVDHYDEDWSRLAWVQVRGVATLVEDTAERERAHTALRNRYPQYRAMQLENLPLIRIMPRQIVGWSAGGPTPDPSPSSAMERRAGTWRDA